MSKHPIPDWLRSQFSRIEDEFRKLGPCGVFTQMRTVTQTYFEQLAAAPQPPALGGEPATWVECSPVWLESGGDCAAAPRICVGNQGVSHLHPEHVQNAPLQAEIEQNKELLKAYMNAEAEKGIELVALRSENDQLKAGCDELQILLACRDEDMKSVSVEFDGLAQLLRCALPFVQARCDETDYGDASARTTREGILSVLKRLYPSGLAGSECCLPTAEEKALLAAGDCTPEELWGGSRPTCPKCIGRATVSKPAGSEQV